MNPRYSVVIPVYGSGDWLEELVTAVGAAMKPLEGGFEVILVHDCSPGPATWVAVENCAARHDWVRGIDLLYNTGQFRALLCGMEEARGDLVLTMDDDFQHPPDELPVLIKSLEDDPAALCVMGRYEQRSHGLWRKLGSRMFSGILARAYGKPKGIVTTSFRIMRRPLVEAVLAYKTAKPQLGPLIVSITDRVVNVPVRHDERRRGTSNYGLFSLLRTTADSVVNASTAPLRFISSFGLICAIASFGMGIYYFVRWLTGGIGLQGFTTQILLTIFFGGMMLLGIGVVGEYVGRIIAELTGPRRYQIARRVGSDAPRDREDPLG